MDTMQCPHCKRIMIPKITRGKEGMHSRLCSLCGKNVESIFNQDIGQITFKTSPKGGLIVFGVLFLGIIITVLIRGCPQV